MTHTRMFQEYPASLETLSVFVIQVKIIHVLVFDEAINDFSFQFRKIIACYKRIGYNLNIMRQSACLVFNPIMVHNYAAFFNCTPVGRASDSMMAPT